MHFRCRYRFTALFMSMLWYAGCAQAEVLPWLDHAASDPFRAQKRATQLIASNLKPDRCGSVPDFKEKLHFSQVVLAVLCHNPDTKAAYLGLLSQSDNFAGSYSAYFPNVSATIGLSRSTNYGGGKSTSIGRNSGLGVDMVLYDFGQREFGIESGELALMAAGHSYNSTLQGAIATAMQGYFNLLTAQNALDIANETERFAKESLDAAELRYQIGQVPLADTLQARGGYSSQLLSTMQAKNQLALSQAALAQLMGQSAETVVMVEDISDEALKKDPFNDELHTLLERAKEKRQDMQAGRASLKSAELSLKSLKRSNLGTLSATADLGASNSENLNLFRGAYSRNRGVGLSVSVPIFTGFANTYNEKAAEKDLEAQKIGLQATALQVEQDVWSSWHNFQTARQSWTTSQDQLVSATELRDVAIGRYKEGLGTILDVLNAQLQYNTALQSTLQARYNVFTSRVDLVRSVGSLDLRTVEPASDSPAAFEPKPSNPAITGKP